MFHHSPVRSVCNCIAHQPLDPLPPADLANLEELYVSGDPLLRSVASPHLRRATVDLRKTPVQFSLLDEVLVNLIQRHKPYGNLALRILTTTDPEEIRRSLPRVAQEGVLKVGSSEGPCCWE